MMILLYIILKIIEKKVIKRKITATYKYYSKYEDNYEDDEWVPDDIPTMTYEEYKKSSHAKDFKDCALLNPRIQGSVIFIKDHSKSKIVSYDGSEPLKDNIFRIVDKK